MPTGRAFRGSARLPRLILASVAGPQSRLLAGSEQDPRGEHPSAEQFREREAGAQHRARRGPPPPAADVDGEGASASYRNGVLTVTIPVEADADVRHIDVE